MGKSGKVEKRYFWQRKDDGRNDCQKNDLLNKATEKTEAAKSDSNQDAFVPPDGGWGWIVCLTSLWANGTVFGIINTFGIVYVQMRDHYSKNDPEVSLKTGIYF